jgi:hypothetical protein
MKLVDALRTKNTTTENGMTTNSSSLNACVDLFFTIGAMRGQDKERLIHNFSLAYHHDPDRAMKILFWVRDVRGGAGERQIFKDILIYLAAEHTESLEKNIHLIPEYGRWDDLFGLIGTKVETKALACIKKGLDAENGLCAKWIPRKGVIASKVRNHLNLSPKQYRKKLVSLTQVVEQAMCAKNWEEIEYGKIPSLAASRYQKAFHKNDGDRYRLYIEDLKTGKEKINAGAVYPYDITKNLKSGFGDAEVANEQWKALPNYMEGSTERILPVVDVSGSMETAAGGNANVTCMDVAVSLGLYISERNEGPFKDAFITFSGEPSLQIVKGSLRERFQTMIRADWAMNTDLQKVFKLILDQAVKNNVPEEQMPTKILILSDMEFDSACNNRASSWYGNSVKSEWNPTAQQMIRQMYQDAGYKMPAVIYWNIQSRGNNIPVSFNETGTALVSGFSPAILKSLLMGEIISPAQIMDLTLLSPRYEQIKA